MVLNVRNFIKETLKLKGSIDVNVETAKELKELEKEGMQTNLLIAELLNNLDYKAMRNGYKSDADLVENEELNSVDKMGEMK